MCTNSTGSNEICPDPGKATSGPHAGQPLPRYNHYKEEGFLHWVNVNGAQCINRVTGRVRGNNSDGLLKDGTVSACERECHAFDSTSDECFKCVQKEVVANNDLCPEADHDNMFIKEAMECTECVAENMNNVWECITEDEIKKPFSLTSTDIALIILAGLVLLGLATSLGLYIKYRRGKPRTPSKIPHR